MPKKYNVESLTNLVKSAALSPQEIETLRNNEYRDVVISFTLNVAAEFLLSGAQKAINLEAPYRKFKDKHDLGVINKLLSEAQKRMEQGQLGVDDIFYKNVGGEAYPEIRKNAFEIIRLVQMHYDRCMGNPKAAQSIQRAYNRLAPKGLFTEEELTIDLQ